jgi:hypothetical protein
MGRTLIPWILSALLPCIAPAQLGAAAAPIGLLGDSGQRVKGGNPGETLLEATPRLVERGPVSRPYGYSGIQGLMKVGAASAPEPGSIVLFLAGFGLIGIGLIRRRDVEDNTD